MCFLQTVLVTEVELIDRKQLETLLSSLPPISTNGHKDPGKPRQPEGGKKSGLLGKGEFQIKHLYVCSSLLTRILVLSIFSQLFRNHDLE